MTTSPFWISFKRILRSGFVSFWRNGFVSFSTISVMVVTLMVISMLLFSSAVLNSAMSALRDKVDINVYFATSASEIDVLDLQKSIDALPEVEATVYISREEALQNFRDSHQNDQATLAALNELPDNPLGAVLNIKAKEASQYESVAKFLEQADASRTGGGIIDKVNYYQNKPAIDKLSALIESSNQLGFFLALLFIAIAFMIIFNTVRLAIFIAKDEISVMRLVGASNMYIRGPFVVTGMMYGAFGAILTLIALYPVTYWLGPRTENFFTGMNIFSYYLSHFGYFFIVLIGAGIVVGAFSSYVAVRKYLQVV